MNVTNLPPVFNEYAITPDFVELGFENVTLVANITDNIGLADVWANITDPGGNNTIILLNNTNTTWYLVEYNTSVNGTYQMQICANDTLSWYNCTSMENIEALANTTMSLTPNETYQKVHNVGFRVVCEIE